MKSKFIASILAVGITSSIMFSCSSPKEETQETPEEIINEEVIEISNEVDRIVCSDRIGVFRGVFLGSSRTEVKLLEDSLEVLSEEKDQISYTLTYDINRNVDIQYNFNEAGKVVKVQADIYPGSLEEQAKSFEELGKYYEFILGSPSTKNEKEIIWNSEEDGYELIIKKYGNNKIHDIHLVLSPMGKTSSILSKKE